MTDNNESAGRSLNDEKLPAGVIQRCNNFFSSVKLALGLLIVILVCCVAGVTILRGERAWALIFNTLWFNGILVLLVINVAFCYFKRMWKRKVTMISLGMILFHLSFVAMLGGIIYNSLFHFKGIIRLTEGESLPSGQIQSYDAADYGRFFDMSHLRGETSLIKMHSGYKVDGVDKRAAYEISVGEEAFKKHDIIYITHNLENRGFTYLNDREGYSLLVILYDKRGRELYGAHIPLQSFKQKDESYVYGTGTRDGPDALKFPHTPAAPLFGLQIFYRPDPKQERNGEVTFQLWPLTGEKRDTKSPLAERKGPVGTKCDLGEYFFEAREVRYWVGMGVRYDPGQPIVLASLGVGLGGMIITFIGRMRKG